MSLLKRLKVQIACLQETHLTEAESNKLSKKWKGQLYTANFSSYARGTLIWVAPGVPFNMSYVEGDIDGWYIFLQGKLDGKEVIIVNSYCPSIDDEGFYPRIQG